MADDWIIRRFDEISAELKLLRERSHTLANHVSPVVEHERRIGILEEEARDLLVFAAKFQNLEERVGSMTRALWSAAGALLIAAVTFALAQL